MCLKQQEKLPSETETRRERSKATTKQDVLKAVHDYKTTRAKKLANHLNVGCAIYFDEMTKRCTRLKVLTWRFQLL